MYFLHLRSHPGVESSAAPERPYFSSHRDDDLSSGVSFFQVPDRGRSLKRRVTFIYGNRRLTGIQKLFRPICAE